MHNRQPIRPALIALTIVASLVPMLAIACRKSTVATGATAEGCNALRASAGAKLRDATRAANSSARCVVDADCIEVGPHLSCAGGCVGEPIPRQAAGSFSAAVRAIDETGCKPWTAASCTAIAPMAIASCAQYVLRCQPTGCEMVVRSSLDAPLPP